jgi:hypothetical protein
VVQFVPLSVEYCRVDPAGQGVPLGPEMLPPATVHVTPHVLFIIVTLTGADVNTGQIGHELTVIVLISISMQPLALVTVTVYVLVIVGDTVMAAVVAAVLQR